MCIRIRMFVRLFAVGFIVLLDCGYPLEVTKCKMVTMREAHE